MSHRTDPKDIGARKPPEVNETAPYLKDTDQRWFSEVGALYPSKTEVWDGEGYMPKNTIRKLAHRYMEAALIGRLARKFMQGGSNVGT